jgi:hypothetical protein
VNLPYVVDERTGVAIVQPARGFFAPHVSGIGTVTYRCHSCGELIPKHWEVFFFDPADGWAGYIMPAAMPPTMTTHHDWHMAATQET